jgi:hypothetical protein
MDGFLLDRGFQVLLADYPELRRAIRLDEIATRNFYPGIFYDSRDGKHLLTQPMKIPGKWMETLQDMVKLLGAPSRALLSVLEPNSSVAGPVSGLPPKFRDTIAIPFLRAVTLDPELTVSTKFAIFLLTKFLAGTAVLPVDGMASFVSHLASNLEIRCSTPVESVSSNGAKLANGEILESRWTVVATDPEAAGRLLSIPDSALPAMRLQGYAYYLAESRPLPLPAVYVPSKSDGIWTVAVISDVEQQIMPADAQGHLISVSFDPRLSTVEMQSKLETLFPESSEWSELVVNRVEALPSARAKLPIHIAKRIVLAGDYLESPSLNGAMASGRKAADLVLNALKSGEKD